MLRDLIDGGMLLASIGAGVALLWYFGRDRDGQADDHDLSDYQPEPGEGSRLLDPAVDLTVAVDARAWVDTARARRRLRAGAVASLDVLPPAPAGATAPLSVYAEVTVEGLQRARYGSTDPAVIAARMLAEIAADEHGDVIWNRATDRDLTGVFPVVAVAR